MNFARKLVALGGGAVAAVGMTVFAGASEASAVSCPDNGWAILDGRVGKFFNGNGINIRTGPSTGCASVGQGQASHDVQVDCWKSGEGGSWSHLFDLSTGKEGWSKDTLLVGGGAHVHC